MKYLLKHGWRFYKSDKYPKSAAEAASRDANGRLFYDPLYDDGDWEDVTLPHSFNDADLFKARIRDAGSGQFRGMTLYRKFFEAPQGERFILGFEGARQACYVYINGFLAGWSENGVAPFALDITPYVKPENQNLIAVALDNTSSRNIDFCIAETPNHPDALPGSFLAPQDTQVPDNVRGAHFQWNCNDFNPSVGGLTRPVYLYVKNSAYLSLPYYSNLKTRGTYVYGSDYRISGEEAFVKIHAESEVVNTSGKSVSARLKVIVKDLDGEIVSEFSPNETTDIPPVDIHNHKTIIPEGAYIKTEGGAFEPVPEEIMPDTETDSENVYPISAVSEPVKLILWSPEQPKLYEVNVVLLIDGIEADSESIITGFRKIEYDKDQGVLINSKPVWLTGYAQRSSNEWAAIGIAPDWLKDFDMRLVRESNSNHIRFMHVAASPADIRACDRNGIIVTQPAGDKEAETFSRQWAQRLELMRDVIIYFRNNPSIVFWEAGNNSISPAHMRQMRLIKHALDPHGGRFMGCRTLNTEDALVESEYVGTMLNRHAARFLAEHGPITETEYSREEAPKRVWDDFTPPYYDYRNLFIGKGGKKQVGRDFYDLTMEDLCLAETKGYAEFFFDRVGGASKKNLYSAAAALCWTDSAQHGRQSFSENARMSGRVDAARVKKQNYELYRVLQSASPAVYILGHWNYPADAPKNYLYPEKRFNGSYFEETGTLLRRDPKHKTVFVAASYCVKRVELYINGTLRGVCDKPADGFIFAFPDIDITENGEIRAIAYAYEEYAEKLGASAMPTAEHSIKTVGKPAKLLASLNTSPNGFVADGADIAFIDIKAVDENGFICPLCDAKLNIELEGDAHLLGGYNSGSFDLSSEEIEAYKELKGAPPLSVYRESVIHKPYVYLECGEARVFLRAGLTSGGITVKIKPELGGVESVKLRFESVCCQKSDIPVENSLSAPSGTPRFNENRFFAIVEADQDKYVPEDRCYCKILVNGQEPDTRGVRSVNENGSVWGAVLCILERMKQTSWKDDFDFSFDRASESLSVTTSQDRAIEAKTHRTHLTIDGYENLMDGEPYMSNEGQFVMEVSAIAPWIPHTSCVYDEKVNVLRIERRA